MKRIFRMSVVVITTIAIFVLIITLVSFFMDKDYSNKGIPVEASSAIHYNLNESFSEKDLTMSIKGVSNVKENVWEVEGDYSQEDISLIKDNYSILLGKNDLIIRESMSDIENNQLYIYYFGDKECDFNQIVFLDNRTKKVFAVIQLN